MDILRRIILFFLSLALGVGLSFITMIYGWGISPKSIGIIIGVGVFGQLIAILIGQIAASK